MFAIRKGNTITIAPLEDALVGLQSGWAIRFADKPQFLFRISRENIDGLKMTMDQAIENCARIARREGLDLRSNACDAQVFELATDGEHKACELLGIPFPSADRLLPAVKLVQDRLAALEATTACDYCDSIQNMTGTRNCPIHAAV
jgi:hypothetical protein